jgi:hypothetical protein
MVEFHRWHYDLIDGEGNRIRNLKLDLPKGKLPDARINIDKQGYLLMETQGYEQGSIAIYKLIMEVV